MPFLAYNGVHGAITTLGRMDYGIEIDLSQLSSVQIAPDGKTVKIGGGTMSKAVTDTLWPAGKETGAFFPSLAVNISDNIQLPEHANASAISAQP